MTVVKAPLPPSTTRSLLLVYAGFGFRYLYLLILLPFYGRVLGSVAYGRVLAAMSMFQIVWMVAEYGFAVQGLRDVAAAGSRRELGGLYGRHVRGRVVMAVPALLVGALGTACSVPLRESPALGALATLNGVAAAFNMGWYFQGLHQFGKSVSFELLGFVLNLVLILSAVSGPSDAWCVLLSLLLSTLVCTSVAHIAALRTLDDARATWREAWILVKQATPLFGQRSLTSLVASSSTYIVSAYSTAAQVGVYGSAERLAAIGLGLLQPANQVVMSTVSGRVGRSEDRAGVRTYMRNAVCALSAFGVLLLVGTLLLAEPVVPLVLGPEFTSAVPILHQLGWMFPFAALSQAVTGYVLIPLQRDHTVLRVATVGALFTLVAEFVLVRSHGGPGVAAARVAGAVVTAIAFAWLVRSHLPWPERNGAPISDTSLGAGAHKGEARSS